ncbi:hypothetical protein Pmi06nite_64480 [Planotetraspora mira]|uniref:Alpha/beta hydrolase family protein n=1 Tax=Planotetraspora mira TaxID=58121 RepID=A0A8J3XA48_9ACTN|nr:hypothetical protein [Planotetraspora mira]GII33006.1 hypothetical protein Pmi06nite_64480 [Planotetraspora mira]
MLGLLVGHSYGGMVITNAAVGNPNVKALVYDDAYIPAKGETVFQINAAKPGSCVTADPSTFLNLVQYPGSALGDYDAYLSQARGRPHRTRPGQLLQCAWAPRWRRHLRGHSGRSHVGDHRHGRWADGSPVVAGYIHFPMAGVPLDRHT